MGRAMAAALLAALCLATGVSSVFAANYNVYATGVANARSPQNWGMAFSMGSEESNTLTMLKYLNPTFLRMFIQPIAAGSNWRNYVANKDASRAQFGNQFGKSFDGTDVTDINAYKAAVTSLQTNARGQPFFEWLNGRKEVDWATFTTKLSTTEPGIPGASGNPDYYIKHVQDAGYDIMAMWDIRCNSLDFNSTDPASPDYWRERWELYRLTYVGGRWFAQRKITKIELYNEPDRTPLNAPGPCMNQAIWEDDVRIRSQALQQAFADHNAVNAASLQLRLIGPTLSVYYKTSYSEPMFRLMHTPFPDNVEDPSFTLFNDYSYHRYGDFATRCSSTQLSSSCRTEQNYLMRQAYDKAKQKLSEAGYPNMEIMLTEFNCFTAATSDNVSNPYFRGRNVADTVETATCLGSQIAHLIKTPGGPNFINLHRLTQSYFPNFPSKISKNGIMFGSVHESPFFLTASTKSAEVYRLIRRRSGRGASLWEFACGNDDIVQGRLTIWGADDFFAYYIYVNNEEWNAHKVFLDLNLLPGVNPYGTVVATSVGYNTDLDSTYHGEVAWMRPLGDQKKIEYLNPKASFYMLTVPKVPVLQTVVLANGDATVRANGIAAGLEPTLEVATSGQISVAVIKFKPEGLTNVVSAVLKLHLLSATNSAEQVMSVLALPDDWHEASVAWSNLIFLKPAPAQVTKTTENFINWWSKPQPSPIGYMTIPRGDKVVWGTGQDLKLDVTDAVQSGIYQFMLVRVFRYDESKGEGPSKLPADNVQGTYVFASKDSANVTQHPSLLIDYYTT